MVLRAGVCGTPLIIAILCTGCRSVWLEPRAWPWHGSHAATAGASAVGDDSTRLAATDVHFRAALASWSELNALDPTSEQFQLAWESYHENVAHLLVAARDDGRFVPGKGLAIGATGAPMLVPLAMHGEVWRQDDVQALYPVASYRVKALSRQYRTSGWGVPVVVERCQPAARRPEEGFLTEGSMFAATALLRPRPSHGAVLELFDPLHPQPGTMPPAGPMASDLSAPFALSLIRSPELQSDWLTFFGIDMPTRDGLHFLEPYQPGKIPIVLVHGILSNPVAWVDLANDLRALPGFADQYQIWAFRYPTGAPFLASASRLRRDLYQAVAAVDPAGVDPALNQMVLVGHSMGGLICELQASSSEDRLWNAIANRPLSAIVASDEARRALQDMFFFDPQPNVRCVVSLAAPHEGSNWAVRPIGRLGAALARPDPARAARHEDLLAANPGVFSEEVAARVPTSVDMLNPDSALLNAIASLPTSPCVDIHTIVGYGRHKLAEGPGDGIVAVDSALSPKAKSQVGVDASHTNIHRKLESVDEIVRILNEHRARYVAGWKGSAVQ